MELAPGQIRDSNRPMLLALVAEAGAEPVDLGIGRDDEAAVTAMFRDAAARCDAIITTGGVSVGDYDVVKAVLEQLGTLEWWQVAIKPAKPFAFGRIDGTPIFGLPGNPVSSHVSFELFARPALRRMMGHTAVDRPVVRAVAGAPLGAPRRRPAAPRPRAGHLRGRRATSWCAAARRRATCCRGWPRPTGSRCSPTATASPRATSSTCMLPRDTRTPALRRARLNTEPEGRAASERAALATIARAASGDAEGRRRRQERRGSARGSEPPGTLPPARCGACP